MTTWKDGIVQRFDRSAQTYEANAGCQREIALQLRDRLREEAIPQGAKVLEVGCGTGFLTTAILGDLAECQWLATDISPRMLAFCAARMDPRVTLRVMDGEFPDLEVKDFDLVVSSMAVQWFHDLGAGLGRLHELVRPGGLLAVTTLGSETFHEWRELCFAAGGEASEPGYATEAELQQRLGCDAEVHRQTWPVPFDDLQGFLHHLKSIGARTAATGHTPMSPGTLRRILRAQEGRPFTATYDVLTVLWRKPLHDAHP